MILQIQGVSGECKVYLNGIESVHQIGSILSEGGSGRIQIPATALKHGEENVLLLEITAPPSQKNTFLGSGYPNKGKITGLISLQAVMETSIESPRINVRWEEGNAQVQVGLQLSHHEFLESGPWTVQGVISDGSAEVAQAITQVTADENEVQSVTLNFQIPQAHPWSPEDPYLYNLYLTVSNNKGDKDDLAFPLGLKIQEYREGKFFLNGEENPIKGLVLSPQKEYEIRAGGDIAPWLKDRKSEGYNLIYFPGQLPDNCWLEEADRVGIGLWVQLPGTAMVPAQKLPEPRVWQEIVESFSLHPSVWAYTSGVGLEYNSPSFVSAYEGEVQTLTAPLPAFTLKLPEQSVLTETWGEIEQPQDEQPQDYLWPEEKWVSIAWAILLLLVAWLNLTAVSWRYKELQTVKPKRALRKAWLYQGIAMLTRQMTLAGIFTALIFNTQIPWSQWIPNQWPLWEGLRLQSPWLVWLTLGSFFALMRLLHVGVVAPRMPGFPAPTGLAAWLEKRYSWNWLIGLLWALQPWGVPRFASLLAYIILNLLFLPMRIRDVKRIGAGYAVFLWVPGLILLLIGIVGILRWEDLLYAYQMVQQIQWIKPDFSGLFS